MSMYVSRSGTPLNELKRRADKYSALSNLSHTERLDAVAREELALLDQNGLLPEPLFGSPTRSNDGSILPSTCTWSTLTALSWRLDYHAGELTSPIRSSHPHLSNRRVSFVIDFSRLPQTSASWLPQIELESESQFSPKTIYIPANMRVERRSSFDYPVRLMLIEGHEPYTFKIPIHSKTTFERLKSGDIGSILSVLISLEYPAFEAMRHDREASCIASRAHFETAAMEAKRDMCHCCFAHGHADGYGDQSAIIAFCSQTPSVPPTLTIIEYREDSFYATKIKASTWNTVASALGASPEELPGLHQMTQSKISCVQSPTIAKLTLNAFRAPFSQGISWPMEHAAWLVSRDMDRTIEITSDLIDGKIHGIEMASQFNRQVDMRQRAIERKLVRLAARRS